MYIFAGVWGFATYKCETCIVRWIKINHLVSSVVVVAAALVVVVAAAVVVEMLAALAVSVLAVVAAAVAVEAAVLVVVMATQPHRCKTTQKVSKKE